MTTTGTAGMAKAWDLGEAEVRSQLGEAGPRRETVCGHAESGSVTRVQVCDVEAEKTSASGCASGRVVLCTSLSQVQSYGVE